MYRTMEGPGETPVTTTPLPNGDQGTRKTLEVMQRFADSGSRDIVVREAVSRVIRGSGVMPHDIPSQVRAWFTFVRDQIYFLHDPVGTEWVQAPRYTLQIESGDCDDRATLLAAGLRAFGVPSQFKVVAVDRSRPSTFSHVYVVATVLGRPVALDPTYAENTLGTEPPHTFRTWMVPA